MKRLLIISIMAMAVNSCIKCDKPPQEEGDLRLRFENKTGEDLNNLTVGDRIIGDLRKGETSCYFAYENLLSHGKHPLLSGTAQVGKVEVTSPIGFCGTGAEEVWGDNTVKIDLNEEFMSFQLKE